MKTTTSTKSSDKGSGVVQVAIWRESSEFEKMQDVFSAYSSETFYDFAKPLRLLDSPGWSPMIRASSDQGFFVFSMDEYPSVLKETTEE